MNMNTSRLTLRDIVAPGPVERGLFLVEKGSDTASRLMDRLVDLLWWDSMAMPGAMSSRLASWAGASRPPLLASRHHRRHSRIGALHWIDTGRLFNAGALTSQSRLRGMDANRVARSIRVQYPVSALQYLGALERIPNAALCALGESARPAAPTAFSRHGVPEGDVRPSSSVWWTPLVIVSDLFSPLADHALPGSDREEISQRVLERLRHLKERAVVIGFTERSCGDRTFAQEIQRMSVRIDADRAEPVGPGELLEALIPAGMH